MMKLDEIISLTSDLIRFRSTTDRQDQILACMGFIEQWLSHNDVPFTKLDNKNTLVLATSGNNSKTRLLLMSHIDVVDGDDTQFEPAIRDNALWGRGSIDDKYAVALSMILTRDSIRKGLIDIPCLLITSDEETGGRDGAKVALRSLAADFCIALDGGDSQRIIVREKGLAGIKLTAHGKAAHGSRPWLGANAIDILIEDYHTIRELFFQTSDNHWHRTVNFGIVTAGKAINQVPDKAEGHFDIRYTENDNISDLLDTIRSNVKSEMTVLFCEPLFDGGKSPFVQKLLDACPGAKVDQEHGASDARFLSECGIDGVVWGADGDHSSHGPQEHVSIESLGRLHCALERFIENIQTRFKNRAAD